MKLFVVELRRFASRRSNQVLVLVAIGFMLLSLSGLTMSSHSPTAEEVSTAETQARESREELAGEYDECAVQSSDPARDCGHLTSGYEIDASQFLPGVVVFSEDAADQLSFLFVVFAFCGLLTAGSFIGAEWTSGGMTNLLLWQPRRGKVFAAKTGAAVSMVSVVTWGYTLVHLGALWAISATRGLVGDLTPTWWAATFDLAGRLFLVVVLATVLGVAFAMIGRRTVTGIAVVIAYLILVEYGGQLMSLVIGASIDDLILSTYLVAWINDGLDTMRPDYTVVETTPGWLGGLVLIVVTAVVTAVAAVRFQRQDAN
ncbi:ABC-2 family transporter [Stackebrandtia albiflava]|uniref:ABC-2 family transporter n=1 Tax=Stackebrandtia albiflava TaxID=406432 RepID=A0A562VB48_9ACTN|nr:ABC transporter permease subunit [Stackebrandtia albiflava]TWJ15071.1 ABC-2 family transporter [Stackebrandtia albiflava]